MKIRTLLITGIMFFAPAIAAAQVYSIPGTISGGGSSGAVVPPGTSAIGAYMTPRFTVYAFSGLDVIAFAMIKTTCTAYKLSWGDGSNSDFTPSNPCTQAAYATEQMKQHTYAAAGTYQVTFTADGTTDTRSVTVGPSSSGGGSSGGQLPGYVGGGYNPNPVPLPPGYSAPIGQTCTDDSTQVCARPNGCVPPTNGSGGMTIMSCQLKNPQTYSNSCAALKDGASVIHTGACDGTESNFPGTIVPVDPGAVIPMQGSATTGTGASTNGVQAYSSASASTGGAMSSMSGGSCPTLTSSLRRGSTGDQVTQLQQFLASQYSGVLVTGYFGSLTSQFVIQFQADHGIIQTGIVGPLTRAAIAASCN